MPRVLSPAATRTALAFETPVAFLPLLSFTDHLTTPTFTYRVVCNTENITSRSNVYTACFFEFSLPDDNDEAPKGITVAIDNVELNFIKLLRTLTKPVHATLEIVLSSSPDVVEMTVSDLLLREIKWDAHTITGTLVSDDPLNQKFPADIYEPRTFIGMF